jgi:excisionase family DNA binding protein
VGVLEAIRDVLDQADEIRPVRPDVASRLAADAEQLIAGVPALTVHQVAEALSQSKPTIHAWIKAGVLDATPVGRKLAVSPASVLALMPVIQEWRAGGGRGRPMRMLREWLTTEQQLKAQRQEVGRLRRQGSAPLLWPGGGGLLSERTRQRLAARGLSVGPAEPGPPARPAP